MNRFLVQFLVPTFLGPIAILGIMSKLEIARFGLLESLGIAFIGAFPGAFLSVYYTAIMELAVSRGLRPGSILGTLLSVVVGTSAGGATGFLFNVFPLHSGDKMLTLLAPWLVAGALVGAVTGLLVRWCEQRWPVELPPN